MCDGTYRVDEATQVVSLLFEGDEGPLIVVHIIHVERGGKQRDLGFCHVQLGSDVISLLVVNSLGRLLSRLVQRGGTAYDVVGLLVLHVLIQEPLHLPLVLQLVHVCQVQDARDHRLVIILVPEAAPRILEMLCYDFGAVFLRGRESLLDVLELWLLWKLVNIGLMLLEGIFKLPVELSPLDCIAAGFPLRHEIRDLIFQTRPGILREEGPRHN